MSIVLRPAWQRRDATIESDARALWGRLKNLPENVGLDTRASELCAAAYDGHELLAVSTVVIREVEFVRCRVAMARVSVDPNSRRMRIATQLLVYTRMLLELWAFENPDEQVKGMGTVSQNPELNALEDRRMMLRSTRLGLVGYTQNNEPMRIAWFDTATIQNAPPVFGPSR
jgi:hypothetical protein